MKTLVKTISRTKLVDGLYPHTLTSYFYSDGSVDYRWQTPTSVLTGFDSNEYLKKLKYLRAVKATPEGYEEPLTTLLIKYKNGKPIKAIGM